MVRIRPEIKELMEEIVEDMNGNKKLVTRYNTWKDENERINASIMSEVRRETEKEVTEQVTKKVTKQFVLNMYKNGLSFEMISNCTNWPIEDIKLIIEKE